MATHVGQEMPFPCDNDFAEREEQAHQDHSSPAEYTKRMREKVEGEFTPRM